MSLVGSQTCIGNSRCSPLNLHAVADVLQLDRYMTYNVSTKQFSCTEFALSLPGNASMHTLHVQPPTTERDVSMTDI